MKVGLFRHFKVKQAFPQKSLLTKAEVLEWFKAYDSAGIEVQAADLQNEVWNCCFSSPMHRTMMTARQVYSGEIVEILELKELDILHLLPGNLKLPFMVWGIWVRVLSAVPNSETLEFRKRIRDFLQKVLSQNQGNILIVSHWFVMKELQKELIRHGLRGDKFTSPEYGRLYVFERN